MSYRISALGAALRRMWRTAGLALPTIIANAAVQALLLVPAWPNLAPWLRVVATVVSALVILGSGVVLLSCGLSAADDSDEGPTPATLLRLHGPRAALWTAVVLLLVLLASLVYTVPGLVLAAVLLFVPTAAVAGAGFAAGLQTIRNGPGRWLATAVAVGILGAIAWLASALLSFFLQATLPLSALFSWLLIGLIAWWVATGLALVYRAKGGEVVVPSHGRSGPVEA